MNMVSVAMLLVVTMHCFRHFKAIQNSHKNTAFPPHFLHICRKYTLFENVFF